MCVFHSHAHFKTLSVGSPHHGGERGRVPHARRRHHGHGSRRRLFVGRALGGRHAPGGPHHQGPHAQGRPARVEPGRAEPLRAAPHEGLGRISVVRLFAFMVCRGPFVMRALDFSIVLTKNDRKCVFFKMKFSCPDVQAQKNGQVWRALSCAHGSVRNRGAPAVNNQHHIEGLGARRRRAPGVRSILRGQRYCVCVCVFVRAPWSFKC